MVDEKVILSGVESDGYAVQEDILSEPEIDELIGAINRWQDGEGLLRHGRIFAVRNLLDIPEIRRLADSKPVRELARTVLGDVAFPSVAFSSTRYPRRIGKVLGIRMSLLRCRKRKKSRDSVLGPRRQAFFMFSLLHEC